MHLIQLVYVSAYINEYGQELPRFMEKVALANDDCRVLGMTLFSNGNIMQLLEGRRQDVEVVYQKIQRDPRQRNFFEMLRGPIEDLSQLETSIGFHTYSFRLFPKSDSGIAFFKLEAAEVDRRLKESSAKSLMVQFAADHW